MIAGVISYRIPCSRSPVLQHISLGLVFMLIGGLTIVVAMLRRELHESSVSTCVGTTRPRRRSRQRSFIVIGTAIDVPPDRERHAGTSSGTEEKRK